MATISSDYLKQQQELHTNIKYGKASVSYAPLVGDLLRKTGFRSVADYGAGKCRLKTELAKQFISFEYYPYDPAFPEYGSQKPADLVVCIDVLEHIEYDYLDNVFQDLKKMTEKIGLFAVHTGPAKKILPDGRNAHLIQQPATWWLSKLLPHFDVIQVTPVKQGFWVLVQAKDTTPITIFYQKKPKISILRKTAQKLGFKSR